MKNCRRCTLPFEVSESDREFYAKVSPQINGVVLPVPEPNFCPTCRNIARLAFRNERHYYSRPCDLCHKPMISVYDPAHSKNVYCHDCWWSEKWEAKSHGREFDFGKPFFDQYKALLAEVPKLAMMNDNGNGSENSEYTYDAAYNKNAYLVIGSWHVEDGMYGWQTNYVKNCIDSAYVRESELMYNCINCEKCHNCQDCVQCEQSADCIFGYDLKGCKDCLFSAGLRHKQYYIWNQPYSKEDYFEKKRELERELGSWEGREKLRLEFAEFIKKIPRRFANLVNCENSTGDNLLNSKDAEECYSFWGIHGSKWMINGDGAKDCQDCYSTGGPELCYNCVTPDHSYGVIFSVYCWKSQFISYSDNCHSSKNLFGCVGMKRAEYCILNKQYSKDEYEKLVPKIIEKMREEGAAPDGGQEWGEFFRPDLAPFAYNETPAQEYYPIAQEEALRLGYRWQSNLPGTFEKETILWDRAPKSTDELIEGLSAHNRVIWEEIFPCVACKKNFKILEQEFHFYKKMNLPLPRLCVDCRYHRRLSLMNPRKLWERKCMNGCGAIFKTTYAPDRPETVYCEKCYQTTTT